METHVNFHDRLPSRAFKKVFEEHPESLVRVVQVRFNIEKWAFEKAFCVNLYMFYMNLCLSLHQLIFV